MSAYQRAKRYAYYRGFACTLLVCAAFCFALSITA
jgi:hypothetical protein